MDPVYELPLEIGLMLVVAVLTILFWGAALALAMAIGGVILLVLRFLWWIVTRPIVWPIQAIAWLFRPKAQDNIVVTSGTSISALNVHDCADRLERLKALLDDGALTRAEYDQMKVEILA